MNKPIDLLIDTLINKTIELLSMESKNNAKGRGLIDDINTGIEVVRLAKSKYNGE